jgi:FixJ family two-component response regulator
VKPQSKPIIYIVDDDESVRRALKRLLCSAGMEARTFANAEDFLNYDYEKLNACLLTDIKMPGISGMELHKELVRRGDQLPVIFITAFDTKETRDQAKKSGAAGYLRKPVDDQALIDLIQWVLASAGHDKNLE